ncbi:hypothetical protein HBA55_24230 [Pseudomaricurvus alkylphenolicus]|jgi:hypothetical protein|uniref:hypothetical protein n=1 Tax=Pseudomaricurvus alkylphenolicus TaxID=1306991 RepID=UPI00141EE44C|nr:hypothetical protein [Pseudomaricurvus alkylphenolicus]NIB42737.1 hypothetical protein [Pseudomaricurvus alkylphenolicus]
MVYRGYFSLAHWSNTGEQFWVRYCAQFHADPFQSSGGVLRKLAARKMQELNAGGISIDQVDAISSDNSRPETIDCVGIFSRLASGSEQMEFRV